MYRQRVYAVMDFIESHLDQRLTLKQLADIAQFSPYHFHRIFLGVTSETLNTFIKRVRLERAAALLRQQNRRPITEVAFACGFVTPSAFARSFKEEYGVTPTVWRFQRYTSQDSEKRKSSLRHLNADYEVTKTGEKWLVVQPNDTASAVQLQKEPSCELAYVRYIGPFEGAENVFADLFSRLYGWAEPLGYFHEKAQVTVISHDNPTLTEESKLRVSACIEVPEATKTDGEVGRMQRSEGLYAVGLFTLAAHEYSDAWHSMWSGWLPESGYEPDDGYAFERYIKPLEKAERTEVELCIPVRPCKM